MVIKHNNPCGAASARVAGRRGLARRWTATRSARSVRCWASTAGRRGHGRSAGEPGRFVEAIVAPDFAAEAFEILTTRPKWKANVRLMKVGPLEAPPAQLAIAADRRRHAGAGGRRRTRSRGRVDGGHRCATAAASNGPICDFAWAIVRHVKSNAIVLAHRPNAVRHRRRADEPRRLGRNRDQEGRRRGPAAACWPRTRSFPFPDSIDQAAAAGDRGHHPAGGSRRDDEVIAACNEHQLAMIFTGRRHFKH